MDLTREQAIKEHRKMWNWIADETINRQIKVTKWEYFYTFKFIEPIHLCYCCEYARNVCEERKENSSIGSRCWYCPIKWGEEDSARCYDDECDPPALYSLWERLGNLEFEQAAYLAKQIAELPEYQSEEIKDEE